MQNINSIPLIFDDAADRNLLGFLYPFTQGQPSLSPATHSPPKDSPFADIQSQHDSPFGENSIFNQPDTGYVTYIDFTKLLQAIEAHKGKALAYDYRNFESHLSIPIQQPMPHFDGLEKAYEDVGAVIETATGHAVTIPPLPKPSKRANINYQYQENGELKSLFLSGKLNIKPGLIPIDKEHVGFSFTLDLAKGIIAYTDHFMYQKVPGQRKGPVAFTIETAYYDHYIKLCQLEGLYITPESKDLIVDRFAKALALPKIKPQQMAWLYNNMPSFVLEKQSKELLLNGLAIMLGGDIDEMGINEEQLVLTTMRTFVKAPKADKDYFLQQLASRQVEGQSMLAVLWRKVNDWGGPDNFTAFVQSLYLVWLMSSYTDAARYPQTGQPETLAYQGNKILGFYTSGYDFRWEQQEQIGVYKSQPINTLQPPAFYCRYHVYQPIRLPELTQTGEIRLPDTIVPAFYLKAFDDKNAWANFEKTVWLLADVAFTFLAVGNLLRLRHLAHLSKTVKVIRLFNGTVQVASTAINALLNFVNDCGEGSLCRKIRECLFWVDLATIGLDVATQLYVQQKMLQAAREAATEARLVNAPENLIAHLDELAESVYRTKNARVVDKLLDDVAEAVKHFEKLHLDSPVEVGMVFTAKKKKVPIGSGNKSSITLTDQQVQLLKKSVVTHIHPQGSSFSIADFRTFFTKEIKEMRAACPDGTVFCVKSKGVKIPKEDFDDLFEKIRKQIKEEYIVGKKISDATIIERLETRALEQKLKDLMDYIQYQ